MKNKKILCFILTLISTVFIGGCSNPFKKLPSADELLNSAKTADYSNADVNLIIDADIKINNSILKSDFLINLNTNIVKKSSLYELDGTLNYDINLDNDGEIQNFNDTFFLWAFAETSENEISVYVYDMFSDLWNKQNNTLKVKTNLSDINIAEIFTTTSLVTEKDTYKVTGETSFKQLSDGFNLYEVYNDAGIELLYLNDLNITVEMIFDESTWKLKSISFIPDLTYFDNNEEIKVNQLNILLMFNNFNKNTDISIPENVLNITKASEPESETESYISETEPMGNVNNESETSTEEMSTEETLSAEIKNQDEAAKTDAAPDNEGGNEPTEPFTENSI